jgi:uncharacterized protein (TIGR02145 family)
MGWGKNIYAACRIPVAKPKPGYYLRWYYNGWHYWNFLPGRISFDTEGEKYRTLGTRKLSLGSGQVTTPQSAAIKTIFNAIEVSLLTISGWMNIRIEPSSVVFAGNKINGFEFEFNAIVGSRETYYSPVNFIPIIPPPPPPPPPPSGDLKDKDGNIYTTIRIAEKEFIIENLKTTHYADGSLIPNLDVDAEWLADTGGAMCWYGNNIANKTPYGALYNRPAINNAAGLVYFERNGVQETGWGIPTKGEFDTLIAFLGGESVAGGKLKEVGTSHWNTPNTGADNLSGFTALPAGKREHTTGAFSNINEATSFWSSTPFSIPAVQWEMPLRYDLLTSVLAVDYPDAGLSVRCVRDITGPGIGGTPSSDTASVKPTELTWKWNETDQKQFVVTTNMARWYIASASSYEGFNVQVWRADNSEQVLDGIFTSGMIVKVTPLANNEDLTNKSFSITIANSSDLMLYGATASGAQTFYGYGDPPSFNHEAAWTPGFSSGPSATAAWNDQSIRITGTPNGFYSGSGSRTMYVWVRDGGVLDPVIGTVLSFGAKDGLAFNQWITGLPQLKNRTYSIFYDSVDRTAE